MLDDLISVLMTTVEEVEMRKKEEGKLLNIIKVCVRIFRMLYANTLNINYYMPLVDNNIENISLIYFFRI